jgi:hypothetical protein
LAISQARCLCLLIERERVVLTLADMCRAPTD